MTNKSKSELNSLDLIGFLWGNRKPLIIIGLLAMVISSIAALMIEEKYESIVISYPAKSSSITFNKITNDALGVTKFGEEEEAEQMLQILQSSKIRDKIISEFQLMKHYDIDSSEIYAKTSLEKSYYDNINFERNKNGAVLIRVLDKDPVIAANIANYIDSLFDSTKSMMISDRALTDYKIKKNELDKLIIDLNIIRDSMAYLTSLNVVPLDALQGLTEAMSSISDPKMKKEYQNMIDSTKKYGVILDYLQYDNEEKVKIITNMKTVVDQAETHVNEFLKHSFNVNVASPAKKKSYPVRWLIVLMSTTSTLLLFIILLLFRKKIKELNIK